MTGVPQQADVRRELLGPRAIAFVVMLEVAATAAGNTSPTSATRLPITSARPRAEATERAGLMLSLLSVH